MALSVQSGGTVQLVNVAGATFTAKLQSAGSSTLYPEGTVFDCSKFKTETITNTIIIRRAGITLLFGEADITMSVANKNMFDIQAPNVTIIGVSRSAKDSLSSNGSTRFIMTSTSGGYHVTTTPTTDNGWTSSDSLTIMNCDFVGVQSVYTSSGGTATFSTQGSGGILLTEGNPDQSGSNLNNILISNVLVQGAKRHGVMIYGGMASKIQNTRVRNAGGHGFYIAGSSTSISLDTCYTSGNYLSGFCLHSTTYSTLNNCASDSNGLGYWIRSCNSITMSSCGVEACQVRSSIPYNLGITLPSSAGTVTVNDIGSDNAGFIKGTSYLFTGGGNITSTSCYSKNPGNRAGESTFLSKYTSHIHIAYGTEKATVLNFSQEGSSPVKYNYRLEDSNYIYIDQTYGYTYDPTNPTESADEDMTFIADILDQGSGNVFGDMHDSVSFEGRRVQIVNPDESYRIENLLALSKFTLPTFDAHPDNPDNGTIYFNTISNKLFIYNNGWYDTCCP